MSIERDKAHLEQLRSQLVWVTSILNDSADYRTCADVVYETLAYLKTLDILVDIQRQIIEEQKRTITSLETATASWEQCARQYALNTEYHRALLVQVGNLFGAKARTADDGSDAGDVLVSKVPDLVAEYIDKMREYENMPDLTDAFMSSVRQRGRDMVDAVLGDLGITPIK